MNIVKSYTPEQLFKDFEREGYTYEIDDFIYYILYQNMRCLIVDIRNKNLSVYSFPFNHLYLIQDLIVKLNTLGDLSETDVEDRGLDIVKTTVTQSWDCSNGECGTEEVEYINCPYCNQLLKDEGFDYTDCGYCPNCGGKVKGWDK